MSEKTSMFVFMLGLVMVMLGVGGVEASINDSELLAMVLVSLTGCGIMGCGALGLQNAEYYDR